MSVVSVMSVIKGLSLPAGSISPVLSLRNTVFQPSELFGAVRPLAGQLTFMPKFLSAAGSKVNGKPSPSRALWFGNEAIEFNGSAANPGWQQAVALLLPNGINVNGINRLFKPMTDSVTGYNPDQFLLNDAVMAELVRDKAWLNGMTIEFMYSNSDAVDSDADMANALADIHEYIFAIINENSKFFIRPVAFQFDVEPHASTEFKTQALVIDTQEGVVADKNSSASQVAAAKANIAAAKAKQQEIFERFLLFVASSYAKLKAVGIKLALTVPDWYSSAKVQGGTIMQIIIESCDRIVLMDYKKTVSETVNEAYPWLQIAKDKGKSVVIGVNVDIPNKDPVVATTAAALDQALLSILDGIPTKDATKTKIKDHPAFAGLAVNDFKNYLTLPKG
jgi:hypothetical protein